MSACPGVFFSGAEAALPGQLSYWAEGRGQGSLRQAHVYRVLSSRSRPSNSFKTRGTVSSSVLHTGCALVRTGRLLCPHPLHPFLRTVSTAGAAPQATAAAEAGPDGRTPDPGSAHGSAPLTLHLPAGETKLTGFSTGSSGGSGGKRFRAWAPPRSEGSGSVSTPSSPTTITQSPLHRSHKPPSRDTISQAPPDPYTRLPRLSLETRRISLRTPDYWALSPQVKIVRGISVQQCRALQTP